MAKLDREEALKSEATKGQPLGQPLQKRDVLVIRDEINKILEQITSHLDLLDKSDIIKKIRKVTTKITQAERAYSDAGENADSIISAAEAARLKSIADGNKSLYTNTIVANAIAAKRHTINAAINTAHAAAAAFKIAKTLIDKYNTNITSLESSIKSMTPAERTSASAKSKDYVAISTPALALANTATRRADKAAKFAVGFRRKHIDKEWIRDEDDEDIRIRIDEAEVAASFANRHNFSLDTVVNKITRSADAIDLDIKSIQAP